MPIRPKILVTEETPEIWEYLDVVVRRLGFSAERAEDGSETVAMLALKRPEYSLLLLDVDLPSDGLETLRQVRQLDSRLPIILFSIASPPQREPDPIRLGPNDFFVRSINHDELNRSIRKALRIRSEARASEIGDSALREGSFVTPSRWFQKLDLFLKQVGSAEVPVLLQGETGVGKEVLARQIHACSPRAGKPFLKLNCAALPSELVESELFGYQRGAFTGAFTSSPGKFEMADGGTILLDEIGDMDFKLQAKLLQVLQDGEFLRLGAKEICRVNVRIIAATHCDLESAIAEGRFRADLYYRLNVIRIDVPSLRERQEEILPLAQLFIKKYSNPGDDPVEIDTNLKQLLLAHKWPGNIRELENVIRKLVVLRRSDMVAEDLRRSAAKTRFLANQYPRSDEPNAEASVNSSHKPPAAFAELAKPFQHPAAYREAALGPSPEELENTTEVQVRPSILRKVDEARKQAEIEAIMEALHTTLWNRKEAAAVLNIEYKALLYKMKKLGIGDRTSTSQRAAT